MSDISTAYRPSIRQRRWRRLSRRLILPTALTGLVIALLLTGFARLGGDPASRNHPYEWSGETVFITGGSEAGTYTTCDVNPDNGSRQRVKVPGSDTGLRLAPWFDGKATLACGRSVSVTAGWQTILYPVALNRFVIVALGIVAAGAWWFGRRHRVRRYGP